MDWQAIITLFVTLIISLTVHEAAHAWVAKLGGDLTAYHVGQVSLNPMPHIQREPFGMVVLPLAMLVMTQGNSCFGYAHAPIDPYWAARHPKRAALMAAAGPLANLLLATIAWIVLYFIGRPESDVQRTGIVIANGFLWLNLILAIFNMLPVPPLDGAGVIRGLVPKLGPQLDQLLRIPYLTLVVFIFGGSFLVRNLVAPLYFEVGGWLAYPPWYA